MKLEASRPCRSARICWHAPDLAGAVLFNSRYDQTFMVHAHDALTFILVTDGAVQIEVENGIHNVGKGQFVAIGSHQVHAARPLNAAGWRMRSLHMQPKTLALALGIPQSDLESVRFLKPVQRPDLPVASLFFKMHYCSEGNCVAAERGDRFRLFLDWLSKNFDILSPVAQRQAQVDGRAEQVRQILSENIFENLKLERVALELGMSPFALIRSFRKSFGICPHVWRLQARANEVARLLRSRVSLADAAFACGFVDQPHMTRVFKKVFGVTPGQYGSMYKA